MITNAGYPMCQIPEMGLLQVQCLSMQASTAGGGVGAFGDVGMDVGLIRMALLRPPACVHVAVEIVSTKLMLCSTLKLMQSYCRGITAKGALYFLSFPYSIKQSKCAFLHGEENERQEVGQISGGVD